MSADRLKASLLVLILAVPVVGWTAAAEHEPPSPSGAALSLILGRPTDRTITLSALSATEIEARVEYGIQPQPGPAATDVRILKAGVPAEFELGPLQPDTPYTYRLLTRAPGQSVFRPEPAAAFHTQRRAGSTFVFAIQGDSHPEREGVMFSPRLYEQTLRNVARDAPDFYITLGDDFSTERLIERHALSQAAVDQVYVRQRLFLSPLGRSSPLFLVNGNHEQAARCNLDGTPDNVAVLAGRARTRFFPLPAPNAFYTGDTEEIRDVGLPRDYYAWTWGDALFVVIDPYWHSPVAVDNVPGGKPNRRDPWAATLGDSQYRWLKETLENSRATYKFVFAHHVLGTGRGGIEEAGLFEWGGKNRRGVDEFIRRRPGWELPIHPLMAKNGVTLFFQGHDHLYAHQQLDGVVYQSCPNPADPTCQAFNRASYLSGEILPNSGHLRVTVAPDGVRVEYVRAALPADEPAGAANGSIAHSYRISANRGDFGK